MINWIDEIEKVVFGIPGTGKSHFTPVPENRFFFLIRDREGELFICQSFMDEREIQPKSVGPFFSVQEATKMLMHWS